LSLVWEQNAFYGINHFNFVPYANRLSNNNARVGAGVNAQDIPASVTFNSSPKTGNLLTQGLTASATLVF
jgi:hypothetical protein